MKRRRGTRRRLIISQRQGSRERKRRQRRIIGFSFQVMLLVTATSEALLSTVPPTSHSLLTVFSPLMINPSLTVEPAGSSQFLKALLW